MTDMPPRLDRDEYLELTPAQKHSYTTAEKEGVVQRFEYTYELGWKTLKDYLENSGLVIFPVTPKQVIKEAFAAKLIDSGDVWMQMLDHRNLLSHTYDRSVFEAAVTAIAKEYLPAIGELCTRLKEES